MVMIGTPPKLVAGKCVLSGRDVARIGAAQAEGFEMAYERTVARAQLGELRTPRRCGISGSTASIGVG